MPGKGHRTAARQAQLSRKRRGRPAQQTPRPQPAQEDTLVKPASEATSTTPAAAPSATTTETRVQPSAIPQPREKATSDASYAYLIKDLRQIAILTAVAVAVLVVLGFVLR